MLLWLFLLSTANASQLSVIIPPQQIYKIVYAKAQKYSLDPVLFEAMIRCESAFNPKAVNQEGKKDKKAWSRGLGQVQYYTAWGMGFRGSIEELHDPDTNLEYAAKYLREKLDEYGSYEKAFSAYNAGRLITANKPHVDRIMDYAKRRTQWTTTKTTSKRETARLSANSN